MRVKSNKLISAFESLGVASVITTLFNRRPGRKTNFVASYLVPNLADRESPANSCQFHAVPLGLHHLGHVLTLVAPIGSLILSRLGLRGRGAHR